MSYPFPIALCAIVGVGLWFLLTEVIQQGGLRSCGIPSAWDPLIAWVLYLWAAVIGPVGVLSYSSSLEVDGNHLLWKRWFGLSSLAFDRAEIHEARIERARSSRRLRFVLSSGPTVRFTQYASGFTKLAHYLGVPPETG